MEVVVVAAQSVESTVRLQGLVQFAGSRARSRAQLRCRNGVRVVEVAVVVELELESHCGLDGISIWRR